MDNDIMQRPHLLVCHEVDRKWLRHRHKSFWRWILELGEFKPDAIKIIQTSDYDKMHHMCEGETVMKWRYDKKGLRPVTTDEAFENEITETCTYCIDKELKKLVIVWINILPSASSRKKIYYYGTATVYKVAMNDGIEDFDIIGGWIE